MPPKKHFELDSPTKLSSTKHSESVHSELASSLAKGALVAQGLTKEAIDRGLSLTLDDGLAVEREAFTEVFRSEDSQIGVKSFLEHGPGKADFVGR